MNPGILKPPEVMENKDDLLTTWNKLNENQFRFNTGQPGVYLKCENGFNHFPHYQNIFVNCTGSYKFSIYETLKSSVIPSIIKKIKDNVSNTQFGCGPCPFGFSYKAGYESRTYSSSLGGYYNVPDENDCKTKCEQLGCQTFAFSPKEQNCKLHSTQVTTPSKPVYKDYRLCVKDEPGIKCISGQNSCEDFEASKCKATAGGGGVCVSCETSSDCSHIEDATVCLEGICICQEDVNKCGEGKRCLRRPAENGTECSPVTVKPTTCTLRTGLKAYQKYEITNQFYSWISIWSQIRRTAAFSHVRLKDYDPNTYHTGGGGFQQDPQYHHFNNLVGKTISSLTCVATIPTQNEYDSLGYDRGHLLASEIIRALFIKSSEKEIENSYKAMMNIFPQNKVCNEGHQGTSEMWRKVETAAKDAAAFCLGPKGKKTGYAYFLTHALIPSTANPFPSSYDLGYSDWILTNYCCIGYGTITFSRVVLTSNPLTGQLCEVYDSDDSGNTPKMVWDKFVTESNGKYTDLNGNNHPFQLLQAGTDVCVNAMSL